MATMPRVSAEIVDGSGRGRQEWLDFFRALSEITASGDAAELAAIIARLEALEDADWPSVVANQSVRVFGSFADGSLTIRLANDVTAPDPSSVYGTSDTGAKGWRTLAAALGDCTTTDLPEGDNLYYTDDRADARIAAALVAPIVGPLAAAVDDAAAAIAGVPIGGLYRNGSAVMIRVA